MKLRSEIFSVPSSAGVAAPSVVREYVQMHGGAAEVVDEPRGAHIRVHLPLAATVRAPAAREHTAAAVR